MASNYRIRKQYDKAPFRVCIVKFGCENCGRRWQSAGGSLTDYQKCKTCYNKCYPSSYKWQEPNKKGNQNPETYQSHNTELCGKCERLGHSCMEFGANKDSGDIVVSTGDDEEITLTTSNDLLSFVKAKEKPLRKKKTTSVTVSEPMTVHTVAHNVSMLDKKSLLSKSKAQRQVQLDPSFINKKKSQEENDWKAFLDEARPSKKNAVILPVSPSNAMNETLASEDVVESVNEDATLMMPTPTCLLLEKEKLTYLNNSNSIEEEIDVLSAMACSLLEEEKLWDNDEPNTVEREIYLMSKMAGQLLGEQEGDDVDSKLLGNTDHILTSEELLRLFRLHMYGAHE